MKSYPTRKLLALLLVFTISIQPVFTSLASAQTRAVPDDRQGKNPQIDQAANGTTVVNIRRPNERGLSHNQYLDLQVGPQGIIFNNGTAHSNTQLAGYILANPNLNGAAANRILNEVTGSVPTSLNGYMEIAGQRADLIIANPNGIVGNNFGFINANRATMTTGIPQLDGQGNLKGFLVNGGDISIAGQGMDATGTSKTEIIAQAVKINAALHAQDLSIITGQNEVNYETGQVQAISQQDTGISLDVGALGSMYANSIMLVGTSKGLGVNSQGNLVARQGNLTITQEGKVVLAGNTQAAGSLAVATQADITNTGNIYGQQNVSLSAAGDISNNDGLVRAEGTLNITASGNVTNNGNNESGQLEAANIKIKSNNLSSTGNIFAFDRDLILEQNRDIILAGTTYSAGYLTATSGRELINTGTLYANKSLNLNSLDKLTNLGSVYAEHALQLTTQSDLVNRGLIKSADKLAIRAAGAVSNSGTTEEAVLEAESIDLQSSLLDNTNSLINSYSNRGLTIQTGAVNNTAGQILSRGKLDLTATSVNNAGGLIYADGKTDLAFTSLVGSGEVLSQDDLTLAVDGDFVNQSEIATNANLTLDVTGQLSNQNALSAKQELNLTATNLSNNGSIQAGQLSGHISGALSNSGLLNSANNLYLSAGTLTNNPTGRIYGTDIFLQATTLNNLGDGYNAPVIAARNNFYLGAQTINNKEHALILSEGDMFIGGALTNQGQVTGQAATINNNSATIEAKGNLGITAGTINNTNEHFEVEKVAIEQEHVIEYQKAGSERYRTDGELPIFTSLRHAELEGYVEIVNSGFPREYIVLQPFLLSTNYHLIYQLGDPEYWPVIHRYNYMHLQLPGIYEGPRDSLVANDKYADFTNWQVFDYVRTVQEERIKSSDPGKILAGKNMLLNGGTLINDKSQVVAGGNLVANVTDLQNIEFQGTRTYKETGTITRAFWDNSSLPEEDNEGVHYDKDIYYKMTGYETTSYTEEREAGQVAIGGYRFEGNSSVEGTGEKAQDFTGTVINEIATEKGYVNSLDFGADGSTISNIVKQLNNNLYLINTNPHTSYFIETDPAFTSYGNWVSSAYFFTQMNFDPAGLAKRLGDAYYEQQLIKEQILQLTGNRYVKGFTDDNEQYQALLDSAIKFAQENNVVVGVELSAEQVANLTESIVWMVEKQVLLPDGQVVTALVPQVYLVEDEKQNFGSAVISGQNIDFNVTNDILNSGTIKATDTVRLSATNINNTEGRIQATDLSLLASNDINNLGGSLTAKDSMLLDAGNNINIATTTFSQTSESNNIVNNESRTKTGIQSVGSVTLTGDNATLVMNAGNDVNLTAAQISNQGENSTTVIHAENDVNLATVVLTEQIDVKASGASKSTYSLNWSKDIGTDIATGNLQISAGSDLNAKAANLAAEDVTLTAGHDLNLTTGSESLQVNTIRSTGMKRWASASTESYSGQTDLGTTILAEGSINMQAGNDITAKAAFVAAEQEVNLSAGNNVNILSGEESQVYSYSQSGRLFSKKTEDAQEKNQVYSLVSGSEVNIAAGNDINIKSSVVAAENDISIQAGNEINVTAEKDYYSSDVSKGSRGSSRFERNMESHETVAGSLLTAGGDVTLQAGGDLTIKGSDVQSDTGKISLSGENVNILSETENHEYLYEYERKKSGTFSKKSTKIYDYQANEYVVGSGIVGQEIEINSKNNTTIQASDLIADGDINITAGGNIDIESVGQRSESYYKKEVKKSGLLSGGGLGFSIGSEKEKLTQSTDNIEQVGSFVASLGGNVNLNAGKDVNVKASDIIAGQDINIEGANVNIISEDNTYNFRERYEYKKSGLTVSLGGSTLGIINSVYQPLQRAGQVSQSKTKTLYGVQVGLALNNAIQNEMLLAKSGAFQDWRFGGKNTWSVDISLGSTKYTSESSGTTKIAEGSSILAGGDVNIRAREKDINIIGSEVSGQNITLEAKENVNIEASANTNNSQTDSKGSSSSIGLSVNLGTGGLGYFGNYSKSKREIRENGTVWNSSQVKAEDKLTIKSGEDTNIIGSQVSGDRVEMEVGGNLNIESLQNTEKYQENNKESNIGFNKNLLNKGGLTGSRGSQKINSDYASVDEQAGIYAGKGGFDIEVGKNTDLKGAVIASEADAAEDNHLSTGTLTFSDIENHSTYEGKGNSIGIDTGAGDRVSGIGGNHLALGSTTGSAEGTTKSAISEGTIEIRDEQNQKQSLDDLSRDTENANGKVDNIFDVKKVKEELEFQMGLQKLLEEQVGLELVKKLGNEKARKVALKLAQNTKDYESGQAINIGLGIFGFGGEQTVFYLEVEGEKYYFISNTYGVGKSKSILPVWLTTGKYEISTRHDNIGQQDIIAYITEGFNLSGGIGAGFNLEGSVSSYNYRGGFAATYAKGFKTNFPGVSLGITTSTTFLGAGSDGIQGLLNSGISQNDINRLHR